MDRANVEEELNALFPRELAVGVTIYYQPTTFTGYVEVRRGDEAEVLPLSYRCIYGFRRVDRVDDTISGQRDDVAFLRTRACLFSWKQVDRVLIGSSELDYNCKVSHVLVFMPKELLQSGARESEMEARVVCGHMVFSKRKGAGSTREPAPWEDEERRRIKREPEHPSVA